MTEVIQKSGFKVLHENLDGTLTSVIIEHGDRAWIKYKNPGEGITVPNDGCGPMTVFSDKGAALSWVQRFLKFNFRLRVYVCNYTPSEHHHVWGSEYFSSIESIKADAGDSAELADQIELLEMVVC